MNTIKNSFPIYVTSSVLTGNGVKATKQEVEPGDTFVISGPATVGIINENPDTLWTASITSGNKTVPLQPLNSEQGINPFDYPEKGKTIEKFHPIGLDYLAKFFKLPYPGNSKETLTVTQSGLGGKIYQQEKFTVLRGEG